MSILDALISSARLSPLPAVVTDLMQPDNPIVAANSAFEQLTGYAEREILGRNCRFLAGEKTDQDASARLGHAVATGTAAVVELLNYRKDGSEFLNAVMIAPVLSEEGKPFCYLGTQLEVKRPTDRAVADAILARLTPKQRAVLSLMARGLRNRQIGDELGLAEKTIKMHRVDMVRRLGVSSTIEAVRLAVQAGL